MLEWLSPITQFLGTTLGFGTSLAQQNLDQQALDLQAQNNAFNQNQAQLNNQFQQEQFDYQKELNAQQRDDTMGVNAQQQSNWQNQFDYQKFLNENQTQLSARDAQKAGLNVMSMTGNNVSSGSPSSPDSVAQGSAVGGSKTGAQLASQSYGQGLSAMSQLANNMMSLGNAGMISKAQLANQKDIAYAGNKNAWDIAKLSDDTKKAQLNFEKYKWNFENENLKEQTRALKRLNDYEDKTGIPYQHRNIPIDTIVGILSAIQKNKPVISDAVDSVIGSDSPIAHALDLTSDENDVISEYQKLIRLGWSAENATDALRSRGLNTDAINKYYRKYGVFPK